MRVALNAVKLFDLNRTESAYLAEIVSAEVNEHIVLGEFLFVLKESLFKRLVLSLCLAARTSSCKRECVKNSVLKLYESFG